MAKPDLGQVATHVKDPMLSDNFVLAISNVPQQGGVETPLRVQCQQAIKPGMTVENVEVMLFGHTLEYAGRLTYSHDMSVTYVENVNGTIIRIFEKWAELIRSHTSQHGEFKAVYAKDAVLQIMDNKGGIVLEYLIKNIWPSSVPDIQMDGSGANLITHQISFKFDWVEKTGGTTN